MPRTKERRVTTAQPVDTGLAEVGRQRAAQTTRALGGTRVAGWIPNSTRAGQLAKAFGVLSNGLLGASRTAGALTDQQTARQAEQGKLAQTKGETYEDQKTRGMQEGYLAAKGRNEALNIANDLHALYERGQLKMPDGTTFQWKKGQEGWSDSAASFLQQRLKGIEQTQESAYFLKGFTPLVEQTMANLEAEASKETSEQWALSRHEDLTSNFASAAKQILEMKEDWVPSKLADETEAEYSKRRAEAWGPAVAKTWDGVRAQIVANHIAMGGKLKDINAVEYSALETAILQAANKSDDDAVQRLLSLGGIKRGDLKLSLAESGFGGKLAELGYRAVVRMNAVDRDAEVDNKKGKTDEYKDAYNRASAEVASLKTTEEVDAYIASRSPEELVNTFGDYTDNFNSQIKAQKSYLRGENDREQRAAANRVKLQIISGDIQTEEQLAAAKEALGISPAASESVGLSVDLVNISKNLAIDPTKDLSVQSAMKSYSTHLDNTLVASTSKETKQAKLNEFYKAIRKGVILNNTKIGNMDPDAQEDYMRALTNKTLESYGVSAKVGTPKMDVQLKATPEMSWLQWRNNPAAIKEELAKAISPRGRVNEDKLVALKATFTDPLIQKDIENRAAIARLRFRANEMKNSWTAGLTGSGIEQDVMDNELDTAINDSYADWVLPLTNLLHKVKEGWEENVTNNDKPIGEQLIESSRKNLRMALRQ